LGFDALMSDYYWLQAIQVIGGDGQFVAEGRLLGGLIDVVTTLNPRVDHPYRFAAVWLTDSEASVRKANELLRRGTEHHPDDWRNYFYLGFNHFFYLDEASAAAAAIEAAIEREGSPVYLRRLAARLKSQGSGLEVAETFLRELHASSENPYARAELEKALDEIATERRARILDAARLVFVKRNGRDIEAVEDLAAGDDPILRELPEEPHGWDWALDEKTGSIVSSYLGHRYTPHIDRGTRERMREWRERGESS
jgi:hypothetical protein